MGYKHNKSSKHKSSNKHKKTRKIYIGNGPIKPVSVPEQNGPTISTNTHKIINIIVGLINNFIVKNINVLALKLNVDPNDSAGEIIKKLTASIKLIIAELDTPEGKELIQELQKLLKEMLEILEPSAQELINILDENGPKISKSISKIIVTAVQEALPPLALINELSYLGTVTAQSLTTGVETTDVVEKTAVKLRPKMDELRTFTDKLSGFINNVITKGNVVVSNALNKAQTSVDNTGKMLSKKVTQPTLIGGKNIKSLNYHQHQKRLIGGRLVESINEFMG